ncbi:chemotaxis protein CheW [Reichenbachiella ulvae]|uniref:Chemotaxis protein CheW n=1 Tax=Reichenbachiella ulvae TaxID=2980104 RepID=A0ABT3CRP3_9BACT|nr:chemotaxis protein CheW [Reichenbachiella ulvae]MCV9386381.1 chemotaxis protein CheW [Reichenbachiella ulvae]
METKIDTQIPENVLSFILDKELFAVNVTKVIEIIEVPKISKIPRSPLYMTGVINVRNHMVPLVDTRVKLGMKPTEFTVDTCVIVVEINAAGQRLAVGVLVDEVQEVIGLRADEVKPAPKFESNEYEKFILGMFSSDEHFAMILDLDQVFSLHEIIALESAIHPEDKTKKEETTKTQAKPKKSTKKK